VRILLVNTNPSWGGGELWFFNASVELEKRGHDIHIVVRDGSKLETRLHDAGLKTLSGESEFMEGLEPDVILCNSRKKDVRPVLKQRSDKLPGLVLRKGIDRPMRDRMYGRSQIRALCHILANSDSTARGVRESVTWFPADRVSRIYNPVPFEPLPPVPGDGVLRIATVSRLVTQKGIDVLLEALRHVQRPWHLELAGDGRERPALERFAEEHGLADRCTFLGRVAEPREVYARADVIAIPSRYEGFCYTAAEASLAALPVIASEVSSLPEVCPEASFVPPDDAQALSRAIEDLEVGPRPAARARALAQFAIAPIFDQLEEFLALAAQQGPVGKGR